MIKPMGLRVIAEIALSVDIPMFGVGGISGWQDAIEYIMVGASAVQICTAFMWRGFRLGTTMYRGLVDFMERKGYKSISDFQGASLKYLTKISKPVQVIASIDVEKCDSCHRCYIACNEGSAGAITDRNGLLTVNESRCDGCGLCKVVCPKDAISLNCVGVQP
jgi:dihydropyrimidine dehydrogenase (NAD+) subunit PreA